MSAGLRIVLSGHGRMATAVEVAAQIRGHEIVGFVSRSGAGDFPTVHVALEKAPADVVVDFTSAEAIDQVVAGCLFAKVPLVTGTTGWQDRLGLVSRLVASGKGTMLHAANFSVGVQLFLRASAQAASLFGRAGTHDVGVEERHHRGKADAPSGTAHELARRIVDAMPAKARVVAGNPGRKLEADELHVASLRAGSEYGRHVVVFDGEDDVVEISHSARGRRGFAMGAVQAAEWVIGKSGVFTLDDMIDEMLEE